jgi:hypothetical protein
MPRVRAYHWSEYIRVNGQELAYEYRRGMAAGAVIVLLPGGRRMTVRDLELAGNKIEMPKRLRSS